MRFDELLQNIKENYTEHSTLVSIDVQPEYVKACEYILEDYVNTLNTFQGNILYFFNGPELGFGEVSDMQEWLTSIGVDEDIAYNEISYRPKYYAFFRNWMDMGMDRDSLIKCIRYMESNGHNDSRDVPEEEWQNILGDDYTNYEDMIMGGDCINLPDIDMQELKTMQPFYLCGGGREECLEEMCILLDSFSIQYHVIERLTY